VSLARLAAAAAISAVVLAGCGEGAKKTAVVPNVKGNGLDYAFKRLRGAGFRVSIPSFPALEQTVDFAVRGQSPAAGTRTARGARVTLEAPFLHLLEGLISVGSSHRTRAKLAVVPDVVGLPVYSAMRRLNDAGVFWRLGHVPPLRDSRSSRLLDGYVVAAQSRRPGTTVRWGGVLYQRANGGAVDVRDSEVTLDLRLRDR
jgi:beta-lactam-binding protein with PASTA domain